MQGFVNLGEPAENQSPATEALVVMVVGLKGYWKAPVAYYLTNTLTAVVQTQLVQHILEALAEINIRVWSITMDGHATNVGMCSQLGCNIKVSGNTTTKSYFPHPATGAPVYIVFDPPHMLKLTRNLLQAYGTLTSSTGSIQWQYLSELHTIQEDEGLRMGNKLTSRHVHFDNQKMKVNLAAQTLSLSVATALETLEEIHHPKFLGCQATAEFIKVRTTMKHFLFI